MKREHQTITSLLLLSLLLLSGCNGKDDVNAAPDNPAATITNTAPTQVSTVVDASIPDTTIAAPDISGSDVRVEVYHFHPNKPCYSCTTMGALAEKTVNTYFEKELASGKLVFGHVNFQVAQNVVLADKYGVTGSSLWIGTYVDGKFTKEENVNVWYKISNEQEYLSYFKGILEKRLKGDLTE
jgi:hypothetical protein